MVRLRAFLVWTAGSFALALLLAAALPLAVGARSMVVRSGSMTPAIRTGDVVVVSSIDPADAEVGDIVTFRAPDGSGRLLVHRVRSIGTWRGQLAFTTQGDANTTQEHWRIRPSGRIGRVSYVVPKLGFATVWIASPAGRVGLLIVPGVLLGISLLVRVWRGPPNREEVR